MTNGHDDGHVHGNGHEHMPDYESELRAMRDDAAHFYLDHFDWKGMSPPAGWSGPRYYPIADKWRLSATLDRSGPNVGDKVTLATSTGKLREMEVAGDLVFDADGSERRLSGFITHDSEGYELLFVPFRDATSGSETYGAGRYLDIPFDRDDPTIELDFNVAYNPSCAYSPAYDCPFPPPQNRLDVAVRAGEMLPFDKPAA